MHRIFRPITTAFFLLVALPSFAQTVFDSKYYNVSISGFPIGHVEYQSEAGDGIYQVQGFLGSSGFFGFFISTRYSGAVVGETSKSALRPKVFRGRFEARRKFAQVDIRYDKNRPVSVEHLPERTALDTDTPLTSIKGALDPISALYLLLRDVDQKDVCTFNNEVFDGVRLSQVTLGNPADVDGTIRCNGVYARKDGFAADQLAEKAEYPFLLEYGQTQSGQWRVTRFLATTDFGVAKATIRDR